MNYQKASNILELNSGFSLQELKKNYYKKALQFHPDKNQDTFQSEHFKEINEAYSYLKNSIVNINATTINDNCKSDSVFDYNSILDNFIKLFSNIDDKTSVSIIKNIVSNYHKISLKTFEQLDKKMAMKIFDWIEKYSQLFYISEEVLKNLREIMKEKMKDDNLIILNPSLKNLINKELYRLEINNDIYYVPLWHHEISFDTSGNINTIVKCHPTLPNHVSIDENNDLHIHIQTKITDILTRDKLEIELYLDKKIEICVDKLFIKKTQTVLFKNIGIPRINIKNIFDYKKISDVIVHICLI
jgi:hypothetical protein